MTKREPGPIESFVRRHHGEDPVAVKHAAEQFVREQAAAAELDPGPEVRAVWTADMDRRRQLAHFAEFAAPHVDFEAWGNKIIGMAFEPDWEDPGRVLDWGCGGGAFHEALCRNLTRFARFDYVGVDLEQAFDKTLIVEPYEVREVVAPSSIDTVVSTACFQHFPSFPYARAVLAEMRRVAAPNARGLIQTRYFIPGDNFDPAGIQKLPYREAFTRYCAWQVPEFWAELEHAGFAPTDVVLEPERQYAWYRFTVKS